MTYFPAVVEPVAYEGPKSRNPLAFRYYDKSKKVGDKTMGDWLKFAISYWHTMKPTGQDPFGPVTSNRPWEQASDPVQRALDTLDASFEFYNKLGVDYWCFHDRDLSPEGATLAETHKNLKVLVDAAKVKQQESGVKLLWGTANLFSHPRYQAGAATNPDPEVFAWAASQVRHAMDATLALGGEGYTFWGGREGYDTILNTRMGQEREQFARLLKMAVDYAKKIGFTGQFYIEPKPKEPTKHQYDSDAAACLNFLREFDLMDHLKLNIETNHATLAGHSVGHELMTAREAGALGSIDANTGDPLLGWDTDQFPTNLYMTTEIMMEVIAMGGFTTGGLNFDAKVRRQSHEEIDLFYAHIGGMDAFARGLEIAYAIQQDGRFEEFLNERYAGWYSGFGADLLAGRVSLEETDARAQAGGEPVRKSGRQERLENLLNEYIF